MWHCWYHQSSFRAAKEMYRDLRDVERKWCSERVLWYDRNLWNYGFAALHRADGQWQPWRKLLSGATVSAHMWLLVTFTMHIDRGTVEWVTSKGMTGRVMRASVMDLCSSSFFWLVNILFTIRFPHAKNALLPTRREKSWGKSAFIIQLNLNLTKS